MLCTQIHIRKWSYMRWVQVTSTHKKYLHANSKTSTCKDGQLEILGDFIIDVYNNSVCVNHNLVYRFRNAHCIKKLKLIRIATPLTSEVIIVTMHTLSYTTKASTYTCSQFSHQCTILQTQLFHRSLGFWFSVYFG